jgi:succinyl-CoA synthetase alpha subunit
MLEGRARADEFHWLHGLFFADPDTGSIIMIGEIGGTAGEEVTGFIKQSSVRKPVAGQSCRTWMFPG